MPWCGGSEVSYHVVDNIPDLRSVSRVLLLAVYICVCVVFLLYSSKP